MTREPTIIIDDPMPVDQSKPPPTRVGLCIGGPEDGVSRVVAAESCFRVKLKARRQPDPTSDSYETTVSETYRIEPFICKPGDEPFWLFIHEDLTTSQAVSRLLQHYNPPRSVHNGR